MALPDMNTILSLNKDPKSIDVYKVGLSEMKKGPLAPDAKHDFIEDRARVKNIKNIRALYDKLNDLEKNGVLDIWIKKFGKDKYRNTLLKEGTAFDCIEITSDILYEDGKLFFELDTAAIVEEMDGAAAAGFTSAGSGPAATMAGMPSKNKANPGGIIDKYAKPTITSDRTHQDTNLGGN